MVYTYHATLDNPLTILVFFVCLAGMFALISLVTAQFGWSTLAAKYCTKQVAPANTRGLYSGYFNMFAKYSYILKVGFTKDAVYIKVLPFFRCGHPPLLIPVKDIRVEDDAFFSLQLLSIGKPPFSSLRISKEIAETIKKMQA